MNIEKQKCVDSGKLYSGDEKLPFEPIDTSNLVGKNSKLY